MTDIVERIKDAENATHAIFNYIFQDAREEIERLRAKIAEIEEPEPARLVTPTAYRWRYRGAIKWQYGELTEEVARLAKEHNHEVRPLYDLPGAQPAPSVPDGWLRAIDEALLTAHIGVANANDTYEQAKAKLDNLIGLHTDVATDPAVNGGWKLVPIEPTQEMLRALIDGANQYDSWNEGYRDMIAAAPEAKP